MTTYNISYTRPYLSGPDRDTIQRTQVIASSPDAVRNIYADCEVLTIEASAPLSRHLKDKSCTFHAPGTTFSRSL